MKLIKQALLSVATATVLCGAPMASADDILNPLGYAVGYQTFDLNLGPNPVGAGAFTGTWNSESIIFWCIELTQTFGFNNNYTSYESAPEPNSATMTLLGQLFTQAYLFSQQSATNSAAFQLAIWEIIYDSGDLDLLNSTSALYVQNNNGNGAAVTQAQTWLANLGNFTDTYHLFLLRSDSRQDFVTFGTPFQQQVPEPASVALLAMAMLAMSLALRRRSRRARA